MRAMTTTMAAPSSPRPNTKMNTGSSTAVTMAGTSVTIMERRASPTERSRAEQAMPSPRRMVDGVVISTNR